MFDRVMPGAGIGVGAGVDAGAGEGRGTGGRLAGRHLEAVSRGWSDCVDAWVGRAVPGESWFRDRLAEAWRSWAVDPALDDGSELVPEGIDELTVLAPGTPALVAAIATAKYDAEGDPWRWLGRRLALELRATATWLERLDDGGGRRPVVVPMPSPSLRRLHRGIDHTGLLAIEVASGIRGVVRPWLARRWGPTQVGFDRSQRRLVGHRMVPSLRWRFDRVVARRRRLDPHRGVLVLDDVLTTGASLSAAARVLRGLGHRRVHAAVLLVHPLGAGPLVDDSSTPGPLSGGIS